MSFYSDVYKWVCKENPLSHKGWKLVAHGGGGSRSNNAFGGSYLTGRGINYAIPLSEVEGYSEDVESSRNIIDLRIFQGSLCRDIAKSFLEVFKLEEWEEAEISPAFTGDMPFKIIETIHGFSVVIGSNWDAITYAGDVYFPVDGMEPKEPRGLMSVSILMMKTDLPRRH